MQFKFLNQETNLNQISQLNEEQLTALQEPIHLTVQTLRELLTPIHRNNIL